MARPKKVQMLQANDAMPPAVALVSSIEQLTENQMREALQPYASRNVKLDFDDNVWYLTQHKKVYDIHGKVLGSGDVKVCGTRQMPIKDFVYSLRELLIEITPGHQS